MGNRFSLCLGYGSINAVSTADYEFGSGSGQSSEIEAIAFQLDEVESTTPGLILSKQIEV